MADFGVYIGFVHYLASQALISEEPVYLTEDFYSRRLSPTFKLEDGNQFQFGKFFLETIKEFCDLRAKELMEYQSSELPWPDQISIMITTTREYFKKKPLILRVNAKELDISEEDFVTITQYGLPKLDIEFTPFEGARTQFYFHLFRNLAVRLLTDFYSEFTLRDVHGKKNMDFVFKSLEEEIKRTHFKLKDIEYKKNNEFEELFTQKKNNDYIYRSLGLTLTWVYLEMKDYFEIENISIKALGVNDLCNKYTFDHSQQHKNITDMTGRLVRRFISKAKYNKEKVIRLLDKIKERYFKIDTDGKISLIEGHQLKYKLAEMICALENLIFGHEFDLATIRTENNFDEFMSFSLIEKLYSSYKVRLSEFLQKEKSELNRLEIISAEQRKVMFIKTLLDIGADNYLESVPRRVLIFLRYLEKYPGQSLKINQTKELKEKKIKSEEPSFKFKGDKKHLEGIVRILCLKLNFLNEDKTSVNDLIDILVAKDYNKNRKEIYLGCNTKVFAHTLDKLKENFGNLKPSEIGRSQLFRSENEEIITAQNIYSSKNSKEPVAKKEIDKIFKQLQ